VRPPVRAKPNIPRPRQPTQLQHTPSLALWPVKRTGCTRGGSAWALPPPLSRQQFAHARGNLLAPALNQRQTTAIDPDISGPVALPATVSPSNRASPRYLPRSRRCCHACRPVLLVELVAGRFVVLLSGSSSAAGATACGAGSFEPGTAGNPVSAVSGDGHERERRSHRHGLAAVRAQQRHSRRYHRLRRRCPNDQPVEHAGHRRESGHHQRSGRRAGDHRRRRTVHGLHGRSLIRDGLAVLACPRFMVQSL
jgi:hypothetical protein